MSYDGTQQQPLGARRQADELLKEARETIGLEIQIMADPTISNN